MLLDVNNVTFYYPAMRCNNVGWLSDLLRYEWTSSNRHTFITNRQRPVICVSLLPWQLKRLSKPIRVHNFHCHGEDFPLARLSKCVSFNVMLFPKMFKDFLIALLLLKLSNVYHLLFSLGVFVKLNCKCYFVCFYYLKKCVFSYVIIFWHCC